MWRTSNPDEGPATTVEEKGEHMYDGCVFVYVGSRAGTNLEIYIRTFTDEIFKLLEALLLAKHLLCNIILCI